MSFTEALRPIVANARYDMTKIAIISTPRSGNTWLRKLLSSAYAIPELAFHTPSEVPWSELPEGCALQIHWDRTVEIVELLKFHQFRVVALARHPLDVLISILQFASHERDTSRWLDAFGGNENSIHNTSPTSRAFLEYCLCERATALLSVSTQWWGDPFVIRVKYESLVKDPSAELRKIASHLSKDVLDLKIDEAVLANSFGFLQSISVNRHFWRGKPGLWQELMPLSTAKKIAAFHGKSFRVLGYPPINEDVYQESLAEPATYDRIWTDLTRPSLVDS